MYEAPAVSGAKWIPLIYKQPSDEGAKPQRDGHVNAPDAASWRRCRMAAVQPWADARRWGVYASPVSADGRLPTAKMHGVCVNLSCTPTGDAGGNPSPARPQQPCHRLSCCPQRLRNASTRSARPAMTSSKSASVESFMPLLRSMAMTVGPSRSECQTASRYSRSPLITSSAY